MQKQYTINKGINRPIEFKGIRAQYIVYLALGLVALLLVFAILYLIGIPLFIILPVTGTAGIMLYSFVNQYSRKYGVHGVMKQAAYRQLPGALKVHAVKEFII